MAAVTDVPPSAGEGQCWPLAMLHGGEGHGGAVRVSVIISRNTRARHGSFYFNWVVRLFRSIGDVQSMDAMKVIGGNARHNFAGEGVEIISAGVGINLWCVCFVFFWFYIELAH